MHDEASDPSGFMRVITRYYRCRLCRRTLSNHNRVKWLSERASRVISESIRASDYTRRKEPGEIEYNWLPRFSSAHFFRV